MKRKSGTGGQSAPIPPASGSVSTSAKDEILIERDASFRRYFANDLIVDRNRYDTQLSFITKGSNPRAYGEPEDAVVSGSTGLQPVAMTAASSEVARIHIPNAQLFQFLMQMLDEYFIKYAGNEDKLSSAIDAVRSLADARRAEFLRKNLDRSTQ